MGGSALRRFSSFHFSFEICHLVIFLVGSDVAVKGFQMKNEKFQMENGKSLSSLSAMASGPSSAVYRPLLCVS
jgi:hypothetical protein